MEIGSHEKFGKLHKKMDKISYESNWTRLKLRSLKYQIVLLELNRKECEALIGFISNYYQAILQKRSEHKK